MHLDLEEQEQVDQIKHFWNRWGNLISWLLIVILGAYAAYNGWQWWQKRQAAQAAVLYDTVENSAQKGDLGMLERSLADIQSRFASVTITQHASLLAAKVFETQGEHDKAKAALQWVASHADDEGLSALARWRLAGLQLQAQDWNGAKESLTAKSVPPAFQALFDERMGDWAALQGLKDQAKASYEKALKDPSLDPSLRRWLEPKLASLGAAPQEK
jgi:predicted negative regulator of RcsB-dependent stress response